MISVGMMGFYSLIQAETRKTLIRFKLLSQDRIEIINKESTIYYRFIRKGYSMSAALLQGSRARFTNISFKI